MNRDDEEANTHLAKLSAGKVLENQAAHLRGTPRKHAVSVEARGAREQTTERPGPDARRNRSSGRSMQLNLRIRPEVHAMLAGLAKKTDSSMASVVEWLVGRYGEDLLEEMGEEEKVS